MQIKPMHEEDTERVLAIYAEGIEDGLATFETHCPTWQEWDEAHHRECRLVAEDEGTILGWAALSPVSTRACYRGVAEISVYVARSARGRGVGTALLQALVSESEKAGYWTLQGATLEGNTASLRVQESCGFRVVGVRERIGKLNGQWRTTVLTERRSKVVGVDERAATPKGLESADRDQPPD
jgi:L-amino acid N-acyltransferase YncA